MPYSRIAKTAGAVGVLLVWSLVTARSVAVWQNDVTLWSHAVTLAPGKPRPLVNLGTSYIRDGYYAEGQRWLTRAIAASADPQRGIHERQVTHETALTNLAFAHTMRGELAAAIATLDQAATEAPANPAVHFNLALLAAVQSDCDRAQVELTLARAGRPDSMFQITTCPDLR